MEQGARNAKEILAFVKKNKCCSVYTFGHQGSGLPTPNFGGTVAFPYPDDLGFPEYIFPNPEFEYDLSEVFESNGCDGHCAINIFACCKNKPVARAIRQQIANRTGCIVCGSKNELVSTNPLSDNVCTTAGPYHPDDFAFDRPPNWRYECALPPNGKWAIRLGRCLKWKNGPNEEFFTLPTGEVVAREERVCIQWEYIYERN